jgi:cytidylate kinase
MLPTDEPSAPLIGIVGPCGSGKTTLSKLLIERGYRSRAIAQEHSFVPTMWRRITNPNFLVHLEASFDISTSRKKLNWNLGEYQEQLRRLEHSHTYADLIIQTDFLSPDQVLQTVIDYLKY